MSDTSQVFFHLSTPTCSHITLTKMQLITTALCTIFSTLIACDVRFIISRWKNIAEKIKRYDRTTLTIRSPSATSRKLYHNSQFSNSKGNSKNYTNFRLYVAYIVFDLIGITNNIYSRFKAIIISFCKIKKNKYKSLGWR